MAEFKPALFDGTDPLYAPGLSFSRRTASWKAPAKYVKAGYEPKSVNLNMPGEKDDHLAPNRAQRCRDLTRDLLRWWEGQEQARASYGTWGYVIERYRGDRFSPYADVKGNTRRGYDYTTDKWVKIIGHMRIPALTFEKIKQIEEAMREKGRSDAYVKRMFTMLRGLASYGAKIEETRKDCREVKMILSDMRFRNAPQRSVFATWDQVQAVVEKADADGAFIWATGVLIQFEFMLRAVDVRGQWIADNGEGGITRDGRRWQDGLTWEMFAPDLSSFEKVISKTARTMPDPYTFDLAGVPYLRDRMARMRPQSAVGPVFVSRTGLPYDQTTWARMWRSYAREAGVPDSIRVMDMRASGATEARTVTENQFDLRDAAQHTQVSTTNRYVRGRSAAANNVVQLRQKARK